MDTRSSWFERYPLISYFALAFGISWGGLVAIVGVDGFPVASEAEFWRLLAPLVAVMLLGPSIAGLAAAWLDGGREGLQRLAARVRAWRVPARWYFVALFTAPIVTLTALGLLRVGDPFYRPGLLTAERPMMHLLLGMLTGVAAGCFEELGWTGFATPALRRRFTPTMTGVVLGVIWGLWHLFASYWGSLGAGDVPIPIYLVVVLFSTLVPYRILMTWVHERTQSVFVAMLMHGALTGSLRILEPIGISGSRLMAWSAVTSAVYCLLVVSFIAWRSPASSPPRPARSSRASSMAPGAS